MARMIPAEPKTTCLSPAEKNLFARFEKELGGEYTVVHSLCVVNHPRKTYTDIDFLGVGAQGVLGFEVKGGRPGLRALL